MDIIAQLEKEQVAERLDKRSVPEFGPGDTVRVNVKVVEGERSRIQAYEGVCIGRAGGGIHENFTVRKISYGGVRRAKLYYLRGRRGKAARIPERKDVRAKKQKGKAFKGFTRPKGQPDDLKLIAGITEDLEKKLNKLGLTKFEQIANLTDDEIAQVDDALSLGDKIEKDDWSAKAVALMAETTADEVPAADEGEAAPAEAEAEKSEKQD